MYIYWCFWGNSEKERESCPGKFHEICSFESFMAILFSNGLWNILAKYKGFMVHKRNKVLLLGYVFCYVQFSSGLFSKLFGLCSSVNR